MQYFLLYRYNIKHSGNAREKLRQLLLHCLQASFVCRCLFKTRSAGQPPNKNSDSHIMLQLAMQSFIAICQRAADCIQRAA
jgi:hypothetical protein